MRLVRHICKLPPFQKSKNKNFLNLLSPPFSGLPPPYTGSSQVCSTAVCAFYNPPPPRPHVFRYDRYGFRPPSAHARKRRGGGKVSAHARPAEGGKVGELLRKEKGRSPRRCWLPLATGGCQTTQAYHGPCFGCLWWLRRRRRLRRSWWLGTFFKRCGEKEGGVTW